MRRLATAALVLALGCGAIAPVADAGAKKPRKRTLRSKVVRPSAGGPAAWARGSTLRGGFSASGPAAPAPAGPPAPTPPPSAGPGYTPPPPPPDDPGSVRVAATEFALTLSRSSVNAGEVTVEFDNSRAEDPHDLVLSPDGEGDPVIFGQLGPGEVTSRTVALAAGTYTLFCSLLDHEARGMRARLTAA